MLTRILVIGVLAGVLAGVAAAVVQATLMQPLIEQAERLEVAMPNAHQHEADDGEPHRHPNVEDPLEDAMRRGIATVVAMISTAIGYGLLMSGAIALLQKQGLKHGLVLGVLGFLTMQLAPSLGAPPAPP